MQIITNILNSIPNATLGALLILALYSFALSHEIRQLTKRVKKLELKFESSKNA